MIKIYIIGLVLAISSVGGWYINKLQTENKKQFATIQIREAQLANQEVSITILKEDTEKQINSVLDSFITLETAYSETQGKRNELIKQIRKNSLQIDETNLDEFLNSGSNILLSRLEILTSDYYATRITKDRESIDAGIAEAETFDTDTDSLEGFYE